LAHGKAAGIRSGFGAAGRATTEGDNPSLWVIGDPNQAIYGFRGSDKRFIDRFMVDYPDASRFELTKSFRCADPIISAAGRLAGSELKGTGKPVDLYRSEYASDKSEAEGVARAVSRLIGGASFFAKDSEAGQDSFSDNRKQITGNCEAGRGNDSYAEMAAPGDCAVLIRAAPLAGPVVKALQDHGIPFVLTGDKPWWEEKPIKPFLTRVRESPSPEDEFQKGKNNPEMSRLFELAGLLGGVHPLLDALEYSDSGGLGDGREGVHIMTIHAAKGLEFDHVFVIGLEDGILPFTLYGDYDPEQLDEERRLLYVAMTRARIGLRLSWARSRNFKGRIINGSPSPFLEELEKIIPLLQEKRPGRKDNQLKLF
jgi:superfamily I DNA/RNA helicase